MSIDVDKTLTWQPYDDPAINIAESVLYQEYAAQSSDASGWNFYVRSPAQNAMLDNEALIIYSFTITSTTYASYLGLNAIDDTSVNNFSTNTVDLADTFFAFRQCWPVSRAMQNLSLTINGINITVQPRVYIDAMNRLYISDDEANNICTLAGGAFDDGVCWALAEDSINMERATGATSSNVLKFIQHGFSNVDLQSGAYINNITPEGIITNRRWHNKGYTDRFHKLAFQLRMLGTQGAIADATRFNSQTAFDVTVTERIPCAPFYYYDSRDEKASIPNIQTLQLICQYISGNSAFTAAIMQGAMGLDSGEFNAPCTLAVNDTPILRLRWYMAKGKLPQQVSIRAPIIRQYTYPITGPGVGTASTVPQTFNTQTFSQINLEGVPDLILIYAKSSTEYIWQASEMFLNINRIQLTVGGASGKLNNITNPELYCMYLKNTRHNGLRKIPYDQWRFYNCVAALDPADIGLERGPGFNYPVQFAVQIDFLNYWSMPAITAGAAVPLNIASWAAPTLNGTVAYDLQVICIYEHSRLILTEDGGAKLELMKVEA